MVEQVLQAAAAFAQRQAEIERRETATDAALAQPHGLSRAEQAMIDNG